MGDNEDHPQPPLGPPPITDAFGVARWTDSICNASVPLPKEDHTGVPPPMAGVHGYPSPVSEIQRFKFDWFDLWQFSDATQEVIAATPMVPTEAGNEETPGHLRGPRWSRRSPLPLPRARS